MRTPLKQPSRTARLVLALAVAASLLAACSASTRAELRGKRLPAEGTTTIATGSVAFNAIVRGPTQTAAKKVVLFLHGASYTSRIWDDRGILDDIAADGYRVVAVDLPSYGETREMRPKEEHGGPSKGTVLRQLIQAIGGPERVVVVSPSMSGAFSLDYLEEFPADRLAGFVPVAPVGIDAFDRPTTATPLPAELVWGENDDAVPVEASATLLAKLPNSTRTIVENAGHAPYDDEPERFTAAVLDFLGALPT